LFKLKFETDNAAFGEDPEAREAEVVRILREIAEKLSAGISDGGCYDLNGNRVGEFVLSPDRRL
jgi:hypothetical protein